MPGPGYEREKAQMLARQNQHPLDRDSILLIDTSLVFDPTTYQEEVIITQSKYSLRDYCIRFLGVGDPEILMDGKPHTIVNPLTYEDMIIQYNPAGKIDVLPPK